MKILILLSVLCNVLSLNSFSKDIKFPLDLYANPVANAGSDQIIYLNQTSTATLDGSGSLGETYEWTEISTDYLSGGQVTSPNSRITTVTGLPQGVFYFRIKVTTGGISTFDSMKVVVDVNEPPKNAKVFYQFPLNNPDFVYKINLRDDTIDHIGYNEGYPYPHSRFFNADGKIMGFIEGLGDHRVDHHRQHAPGRHRRGCRQHFRRELVKQREAHRRRHARGEGNRCPDA